MNMNESTPKMRPRLQFTQEERKAPELKKPIRKAEKAADKQDTVKVATKKKLIREKALDPATGKKITQLRFEEMQAKPPGKLHHPVAGAASSQLHKHIESSNEDQNSGVQATHEAEKAGETALRMGERAHHAHKLRPYRQAAKAERQLDKANLRVMRAQAARNNPQQAHNPIAKWYQKRSIRKEHAAMKASGKTGKASASVTSKVSQFFTKRKGGMAIAALGFMMIFVLNGISACTPIVQTVINAYAIGTYGTSNSARVMEGKSNPPLMNMTSAMMTKMRQMRTKPRKNDDTGRGDFLSPCDGIRCLMKTLFG